MVCSLKIPQTSPVKLPKFDIYPCPELTIILSAAEPIGFPSKHILEIQDDIGRCWQDLGIKLGIRPAKVRSLESDYRFNRERARKVLEMWIDQEGSDATVGCLARALTEIGYKSIADTLLRL